MADHLNVVAIRTNDKRRIVVGVVPGPETGRSVVSATRSERSAVEGVDLRATLGLEGHVKVPRPLLRLEPNAEGSVVARSVQFDAQWPLRSNNNPERRQRLQKEGLARPVVGDSEHNVIKLMAPFQRGQCEA